MNIIGKLSEPCENSYVNQHPAN